MEIKDVLRFNCLRSPVRFAVNQDEGEIKDTFDGTKRGELPSNLILPHQPAKISSPVMAFLKDSCFILGALSALGLCAITAVIPNMYGRLTKPVFSKEEINEIKKDLKPGDIILTNSKHHLSFYFLLHTLFGDDNSHSAMYVGDNNVIDSYDKVAKAPVEKFCEKFTKLTILRPDYKSEEEVSKVQKFLHKEVGKKYDIIFNTNDTSEYYCSEVVIRGLEASGGDIKVPGHVIAGRAFVLPDDYIKSNDIKFVKEFRAGEATRL